MKRVVLTGAATPFGRRVAAHLAQHPEVERVLGFGGRAEPEPLSGVEPLRKPDDHRKLVEILRAERVDTVVQCDLAPDRDGARTLPSDPGVIATMKMGAALGYEALPVRAWVLVGSSSVYPVRSHAPLLHSERSPTVVEEHTPAAALLEAEDYARDLADRAPYLNVAILRLAPLVGPGIQSALSWVLSRPRVPSVLGFDPAIQLLHVDDAVAAVGLAASVELAGVYNVASRGVIRWSDALQCIGRPTLPVLPIEAGPLAPLARALGIPHVPPGLLDLLRFGHAVDTAKLAHAGFEPSHDQPSCLEATTLG